MKIIFLDIDGVLCIAKNDWKIATSLLDKLLSLIADTGAYVVLSSSWKEPTLIATLKVLPERLRPHVIDTTPDLPGKKKAAEIGAFLEQYTDVLGIERYVVIDDMEEEVAGVGNLVIVNAETGLTDADVEKAKAILLH